MPIGATLVPIGTEVSSFELTSTLSPIGGKVCSNGLTLVPNGTRVEALELLANRFDHFEDLLFRYLEAEK